jgi:hypothetical protein
MSRQYREFVDSREGFSAEEEMAYHFMNDRGDGRDGDYAGFEEFLDSREAAPAMEIDAAHVNRLFCEAVAR